MRTSPRSRNQIWVPSTEYQFYRYSLWCGRFCTLALEFNRQLMQLKVYLLKSWSTWQLGYFRQMIILTAGLMNSWTSWHWSMEWLMKPVSWCTQQLIYSTTDFSTADLPNSWFCPKVDAPDNWSTSASRNNRDHHREYEEDEEERKTKIIHPLIKIEFFVAWTLRKIQYLIIYIYIRM